MRNPRTTALVRLAGSGTVIRLSAADREFFQDLAQFQLIATER